MTKSLRSMSESERARAIKRRLQGRERGLGYWSARDATDPTLVAARMEKEKAAKKVKKRQ